MERQVNIMVYGKNATGKSNVIYLMKKFLREQGFNVTLKTEHQDYADEAAFDKEVGRHHEQAVEGLKSVVGITIEEKTIR